jgi:hypothetical protein
MSRRKPLAALAAVTAALALAIPAANASAVKTAPAVRTLFPGEATNFGGPLFGPIVVGGRLVPGSLPCWWLVRQIQAAVLTGNTVWENIVSNTFIYSGCGGAAI